MAHRVASPPYGHSSSSRTIPVHGSWSPFYVEHYEHGGLTPIRGGPHGAILFFATSEGAERRARKLLGERVVDRLVTEKHIRIVSAYWASIDEES